MAFFISYLARCTELLYFDFYENGIGGNIKVGVVLSTKFLTLSIRSESMSLKALIFFVPLLVIANVIISRA